MKKYNVIWIVGDRIRSYKTSPDDDASRLKVIDTLAEDAVEFTNAITSAPSTVISASTMFTGLPGCLISRHYNDWKFDERRISSIQNTLKKHGYEIYTIHDARECRRMMQDLIHPLSAKYFPKGITHDNMWTSKDVTDILENLLNNAEKKSPAFYMLWYDCRDDPSTTDHMQRALDLFKKHGLYENSIIVLNSDHGYPDASTGLTGETMRNFTHDMIITDDNIKVPLILKYPGCPKGKKVKGAVGTLDIAPTIYDILGIPEQNTKFKYRGKSVMGMIRGKEKSSRMIRTDTRLSLANGRATSLRSNRYKYVYYWDQRTEELYDLHKDPYETKDLLSGKVSANIKRVLLNFRKMLEGREREINNFNILVLDKNFVNSMNKSFSKNRQKKVSRVLITTKFAPKMMMECFLKSSRRVFPNAKIDVLSNDADHKEYKTLGFDNAYSIKKLDANKVSKSPAKKNVYDTVFYLTEQSRLAFVDENIIQMTKDLKTRKSIMLDYNFESYSRFFSKWIAPIRRCMNRNVKFYKEEPTLFFKDILLMIRGGISHNIKRDRLDPIEADNVKKIRDRKLKLKNKSSHKN